MIGEVNELLEARRLQQETLTDRKRLATTY